MVISKVRRFLEDNGIAEKFGYIKSLDTIELSGVASNGGERVLIKEIMREYGEETVWATEGGRYLLPCIPEGVIKSKTKEGVIYYTHFKVVESSDKYFNLEIKEYHFNDSNFCLRYIIRIDDVSNMIDKDNKEENEREMEVQMLCLQQFLVDSFSKDILKKEFSESEIKWIIETAKKDDDDLSREADVVITYVLSTFQAINFLSDFEKKHKTTKSKKATVINEEENYIDKNSVRNIDVSKYYRIKEGKKDKVSTVDPERKIIRKTDKWLVNGHIRHYKGGKSIYVQAYYKGPNKDSEKKTKTTFRIEDINNKDIHH